MSIMLRVCTRDAVTTSRKRKAESFYLRRSGRGRRITALTTALFAPFVIFGCAQLTPETPLSKTPPAVRFTCHSAQQCIVQVVVDCSHSPCSITSPSSQHTVAANGFDVVWMIVPGAGQSYLFKNPGGIYFKAGGQNGLKCHPEEHDTKFSCNGDRTGGTYEYGIELVGTPPVRRLDPWIVNN